MLLCSAGDSATGWVGSRTHPLHHREPLRRRSATKRAVILAAVQASCLACTPVTITKTVAFRFTSPSDVALRGEPTREQTLPAGGSSQTVTLSAGNLQVRGFLSSWLAPYEIGARRDADGSISLVWSTSAPAENELVEAIVPADGVLIVKDLPSSVSILEDFVTPSGSVALARCAEFRDVSPSGRHGRRPSRFRLLSWPVLPHGLSNGTCGTRPNSGAGFVLEAPSRNVVEIVETVRHHHDIPNWEIEVFLLGLLGSGAAVTERLVVPRMSQQANAMSLVSIALGLAIAGAVLPDLLVRTPPDRELIHRNLEPGGDQAGMSWR